MGHLSADAEYIFQYTCVSADRHRGRFTTTGLFGVYVRDTAGRRMGTVVTG